MKPAQDMLAAVCFTVSALFKDLEAKVMVATFGTLRKVNVSDLMLILFLSSEQQTSDASSKESVHGI